MSKINLNPHVDVEDVSAWEGAAKRVIRERAAAKKRKAAIERVGKDEYRAIYRFIESKAQFDEDGTHIGDKFFDAMWVSLNEWGWLTEKQEATVLRIFDEQIEKDHEIALRMNTGKSRSTFVGKIKERLELSCEIVYTTDYETQYGTTYVVIAKTENDDKVVLKGSGDDMRVLADLPRATRINVKGTVKSHDIRDGECQTVLNRVKDLDPPQAFNL